MSMPTPSVELSNIFCSNNVFLAEESNCWVAEPPPNDKYAESYPDGVTSRSPSQNCSKNCKREVKQYYCVTLMDDLEPRSSSPRPKEGT